MPMHGFHKVSAVLAAAASVAWTATFTVSRDGRGQFSSIQAAVDAAGKGDIIRILDNAVYQEQVDIGPAQAGLLLTSSNPASLTKPTIRYQDKTHIHPQTCAEAKDTATIDFDQNGALRLLRTRNVTIDGIAIDGGGVYPFGANGVWAEGGTDCKWPMQHGNGAVAVFVSGDIHIRNCDISNAYIGINVKDRNEGGIFANANPADLSPWNVVPLSGFGKTGNHLFERNRIHDNSWGMFFESTWDLGSVVRYNLFFENHHPEELASDIKSMTSEGNNQPGGAMWFKDHMLSPLAIYNNTFWHNYLIFAGHWRPGVQHLIFNNIYAAPHVYWSDDPTFPNPFHKLDHRFVYRMKHCVYAAQTEAPRAQKTEVQAYDQGTRQMVKQQIPNYQVRIMNDFGQVQARDIDYTLQLSTGPSVQTANSVRQQGHLIVGSSGKPFPAEADIRWLETPFQSTDPASSDFLTPDWDDPRVQAYIVDKGYPDAAVRDADGSIADLGAIPSGGLPPDVITIKPLAPVVINSENKATIRFDLSAPRGAMANPRIAYIRFIKNVEFQADAFGGTIAPIPADAIVSVPTAGLTAAAGGNTITVDVPPRAADERYAFFELIIEGQGTNGQQTASSAGFMPYRTMEYEFAVSVLDLSGARELDTVQAGDTVKLKIEARKADGSLYQNPIAPVEVSLNSGADLFDYRGNRFALDTVLMQVVKPVVFTRTPDGGVEYVSVSGVWTHPTQPENTLAFYGASDGIVIKPGPPAEVVFQEPPSNDFSAEPLVVDPGAAHDGYLQVYDRFGNMVDQAVQVALATRNPSIGGFVGGDRAITTDLTGRGEFAVTVTDGAENQVFTLQADIAANPATGARADQDVADVKVGKPRDTFIIFYHDVGAFDPAAALEGVVGERLPIEIWASNDNGATALSARNTSFTITAGAPGMRFYASPAGGQPARTFSLTAGKAVVYVLGTAAVVNGSVDVSAVNDNSILPNSRASIFFELKAIGVDSAFFYADNPDGRIDRAELYYREPQSAAPDSVALYWPEKIESDLNRNRTTVSDGAHMAVDPSDPRHVTVSLVSAYPAQTTGGAGWGKSYGKPPNLPEAPRDSTADFFRIEDRAGPVLVSVRVYERFEPGADTLVATLSEPVAVAAITGPSFTLIKKNGGLRAPLSVIGIAENVSGQTTISFAVPDGGFNAPVAGDSLRILHTGPVVDSYGNHAREDNRPVVITALQKPVPATGAWYFDADGNGVVDQVRMQFAKPVRDLSDIGLSFTWAEDNVGGQVTPGALRYAGHDSSAVIADIADIFGASQADRTGGAMDYDIRYISYDHQATGAVVDSAGPVISSATYRPGAVDDMGNDAPDTLEVIFSEGVREVAGEGRPFVFTSINDSVGAYDIDFAPLSLSGRKYLFVTTAKSAYPRNGDTIQIAAGALADQYGVAQGIDDNKPVKMKVLPKPYTLSVHAWPRQFRPGASPLEEVRRRLPLQRITDGVAVVIDPRTILQGADLDARAVIYDAVGNVIARIARVGEMHTNMELVRDSQTDRLCLAWNGKNLNGRYVGPGTYVVVLTITDTGGAAAQTPPPVTIGVLPR